MNRSTGKWKLPRVLAASGVVLGVLAFTSSGAFAQEDDQIEPQGLNDFAVRALTLSDDLLAFTSEDPNDVDRTPITGLRGSESLVDIDFRPTAQAPNADKQGALYGLGTNSNIYTIDPESGEATLESFLQDEGGDRIALEGTNVGIDFNPTVDRLRIVTGADQNLRANVDTGVTIVDGDLNYVGSDPNGGDNPSVTSVAYTNSTPFAFGQTTALYDIDPGFDVLAQQVDPNAGDLQTIGALGPNVKFNAGFDIASFATSGPVSNFAFAGLQRQGVKASGLFEVNLDTGQVTSKGRIDGPRTKVEGIALPILQQAR